MIMICNRHTSEKGLNSFKVNKPGAISNSWKIKIEPEKNIFTIIKYINSVSINIKFTSETFKALDYFTIPTLDSKIGVL